MDFCHQLSGLLKFVNQLKLFFVSGLSSVSPLNQIMDALSADSLFIGNLAER